MDRKPGVIVLGGHVQGYGIVRVYGENGIPSIVIDTTRYNIAKHSKYCIKFLQSSYEKLVDLLIDLGKENKYPNWLLIPTDDYYVRLVSQNKYFLSRYFTVTVDDWEIIKLFFNKRNSYPLAESVVVPVPKTYYPNSNDDLRNIENDIDYPCIIKPAVMLDFYRHFKRKVFVCNNAAELHANYKQALKIIKPEEILVQEIIPGNSEHQYSVGIFFDRNKSYNYLVGRRKRQHPIDFGNATTFAETVEIPILIDYAHRILEKANFFGICEVEFKYDKRDQQYKFLEVNPRTWKWHLISQIAGVPFLFSLYSFITDGKPIVTNDYKKAVWKDIITDIPVTIEMILTGRYTGKGSTHLIHAVLNYHDPLPFIMQIILLPYFIISRR